MIVKSVPVANDDIMLIPGDLHFGVNDKRASDLMLRVAQNIGVNSVTLVGDTFESTGIMRHGRPARKFRFGKGTIKYEGDQARSLIDSLADLVLSNRTREGGLHVLSGNHDGGWWSALQDDYPGFMDMPWSEIYGDLFDGWHVYEEYTALRFGPLLVCHGHRLRGSLAKYSAASVLANYPGQNTLYGHTHRIDSCTLPTYKYGAQVTHGAWTIGHLRSVKESLKDSFLGPHSERHSQGFAIVYFHNVGEEVRFSVETAVIHRDKAGLPFTIVGGELFR